VKKEQDTQLKSWILLFAGLAGIAYQQWTGQINIVLLLIFTAMSGVPGLAHIISLIKNSPIVLQSSSSQPESSEQESDKSQS
jgi:hypothetical protein